MEADEALALLGMERHITTARLEALDREIEGILTAVEDANLDDEHDPEGATIAFERARTAALRDEARRRLSEIDRAVARVALGSFGRCERCGKEIVPARLQAMPTADRCVNCTATRRQPLSAVGIAWVRTSVLIDRSHSP